jgi:hypothetical protein
MTVQKPPSQKLLAGSRPGPFEGQNHQFTRLLRLTINNRGELQSENQNLWG